MNSSAAIKRVGSSGQISLGKRFAGQYFREEEQEDGTIILVPVAVLPKAHWTVRDQDKITRALQWAGDTPPRESDLDVLNPAVEKPRQPRGR
jgi:hypothetical protein